MPYSPSYSFKYQFFSQAIPHFKLRKSTLYGATSMVRARMRNSVTLNCSGFKINNYGNKFQQKIFFQQKKL